MSSDRPISEEDLKEALVEMAAVLAQFNAKYAVIGGLATAYRSQPRFTKDVDLLLAIPQLVLPGLLHELQRRGFEFDLPTVLREWTWLLSTRARWTWSGSRSNGKPWPTSTIPACDVCWNWPPVSMSPMPPLTDKSTALCRPAASAGHGHDRQQR